MGQYKSKNTKENREVENSNTDEVGFSDISLNNEQIILLREAISEARNS